MQERDMEEDMIATIIECTDDSSCPGETIELRNTGSKSRLLFVSRDSGRGYREKKINKKEAGEILLQREESLKNNLKDIQEMIKILNIKL